MAYSIEVQFGADHLSEVQVCKQDLLSIKRRARQ
jgi:hypothetical protein